MAIEIVDFPINSMVEISIAMLVHQRVDKVGGPQFLLASLI